MYVWEPCADQVPPEVRNGCWIALELELGVVISCHADAGNQTCAGAHVPLTVAPALQPKIFGICAVTTCLSSFVEATCIPVFPSTVLSVCHLFRYYGAFQNVFPTCTAFLLFLERSLLIIYLSSSDTSLHPFFFVFIKSTFIKCGIFLHFYHIF